MLVSAEQCPHWPLNYSDGRDGFRAACCISVPLSTSQTLKHELCHARYYTSPQWRVAVDRVWAEVLTHKQRAYVAAFMLRLGYRAEVHIDEFQVGPFTLVCQRAGMRTE